MDVSVAIKLLTALNVLLGGGLAVAVLRYKAKVLELNIGRETALRDDGRVDFDRILTEVKGQRDEAWAHIKQQDVRMEQMEAEIQGLRLARDLDPFPNWVVDRNGEYLFVNREFERYFLEPIGQTYRDIVGKTHEEHWPPDFCKILKSLDGAARTRPDGTARASAALEVPEFGRTKVTVHKFPIRFKPSGIIVAYAGFITDFEPESETVARQLEQPS